MTVVTTFSIEQGAIVRRAIVVVFCLLALVACSATGNDTPASQSNTPSPVPSSANTSRGEGGDTAAGLAYLESADREAAYQKAMPAGVKIAKAILRGEFGAFEALKSTKTDKVGPAYTGWGGLHVNDKRAYAAVWWQDGAVDLSKGVTGFLLDGVLISKTGDDTYYRVRHDQADHSRVMEPAYFGGRSPVDIYRYPTSASVAKQWDGEVLAALEANLKKAGL